MDNDSERNQRKFNIRYKQIIERSNDFQDLRPIVGFMKELHYDGMDALPFMRIVEDDLYKRGLVTSKIESKDDTIRLNPTMFQGDECQLYICIVLRWYDSMYIH